MSAVKVTNEEETVSEIKELCTLVETSIGANGRLKVLQTKAGGYAMVTSTSSRIFDFFTPQSPVAKILLSGFQSHLHLYNNGGLFLASLCTNLFLSHVNSTLTRQLCIKVNDYVLEKIKAGMEKEEIFHRLDIGKVKEMMIPAFFKRINLQSNIHSGKGIRILSCEGPSTMQSHLVSGIVLPLPFVDASSSKLLELLKGTQQIAVCTTSLAGDQSMVTENLDLEGTRNSPLDDVTFRELFRLADEILKMGVNILCCQKVVHPSVRKFLERKNVFVIERLGYSPIDDLCSAARVQPVESLFMEVNKSNVGVIKEAEVIEFFNKRYLVLKPLSENETYTMMLCGSDENTLDELKNTIAATEKSLFHLIRDPRVVCGGGCFEVNIAAYIRSLPRVAFQEDEVKKHAVLGYIARAQLDIALNNIARSFERIAKAVQKDNGECYMDTSHNHLWCFPPNTEPRSVVNASYSCCCGRLNYEPSMKFESVMFAERDKYAVDCASHATDTIKGHELQAPPEIADSFLLKKECISSAFELCNVVLRVGVTLES
eukprot:Seg2134.4 transcript_id=Seg2134.4/GoldUCD/mRNA.D3Y31 product="McKusick-Kaufman/Bardet-Biedl syndromes putative chaperonin" protein_id=Seg2134.4/GoldUCD/D3Y31